MSVDPKILMGIAKKARLLTRESDDDRSNMLGLRTSKAKLAHVPLVETLSPNEVSHAFSRKFIELLLENKANAEKRLKNTKGKPASKTTPKMKILPSLLNEGSGKLNLELIEHDNANLANNKSSESWLSRQATGSLFWNKPLSRVSSKQAVRSQLSKADSRNDLPASPLYTPSNYFVKDSLHKFKKEKNFKGDGSPTPYGALLRRAECEDNPFNRKSKLFAIKKAPGSEKSSDSICARPVKRIETLISHDTFFSRSSFYLNNNINNHKEQIKKSFNKTPHYQTSLEVSNDEFCYTATKEGRAAMYYPRNADFCDFYSSAKILQPPPNKSPQPSPSNEKNSSIKSHVFGQREKSNGCGGKLNAQGMKDVASPIRGFRPKSIFLFEKRPWKLQERSGKSVHKNQSSLHDLANLPRHSLSSKLKNIIQKQVPSKSQLKKFTWGGLVSDSRFQKRKILDALKNNIWLQLIKHALSCNPISSSSQIRYYNVLGISETDPSNDETEDTRCVFDMFYKLKRDIESERKFEFHFRPLMVESMDQSNILQSMNLVL